MYGCKSVLRIHTVCLQYSLGRLGVHAGNVAQSDEQQFIPLFLVVYVPMCFPPPGPVHSDASTWIGEDLSINGKLS